MAQVVIIRSELHELRRQLKFRKTMLARRKVRLKEMISADEWKIRELEAKLAEMETKEGNK